MIHVEKKGVPQVHRQWNKKIHEGFWCITEGDFHVVLEVYHPNDKDTAFDRFFVGGDKEIHLISPDGVLHLEDVKEATLPSAEQPKKRP